MKKLWKRIVAFVLVVGMVLTTNGIAGLTPVEAAVTITTDQYVNIVVENIDSGNNIELGPTETSKRITVIVTPKDTNGNVVITQTECWVEGGTPEEEDGGEGTTSASLNLTSAGTHNLQIRVTYKVGNARATIIMPSCSYTLTKNINTATVKYAGKGDQTSGISYPYTGKAIKPVSVWDGILLTNQQYDITYSDGFNSVDPEDIGSFAVQIAGKSNYTGTKRITGAFSIVPANLSGETRGVLIDDAIYQKVEYKVNVANKSASAVENMNITVGATAKEKDQDSTGPDEVPYSVSSNHYTPALKKMAAQDVPDSTAASGDYLAVVATGNGTNYTGQTSTPVAVSLTGGVTYESNNTSDSNLITGTYSPDGDYFKDTGTDGIKKITVKNTYEGVTPDSGSGNVTEFEIPMDWLTVQADAEESTVGSGKEGTVSVDSDHAAYYTGTASFQYTLQPRKLSDITNWSSMTTPDSSVIIAPAVTKEDIDKGITGVRIIDTVNGESKTLEQDKDFTAKINDTNESDDKYGLTLTAIEGGLYKGTIDTEQMFKFGTGIGTIKEISYQDALDRYCGTKLDEYNIPTNETASTTTISGNFIGEVYYTGEWIQPVVKVSGPTDRSFENMVRINGFGKEDDTEQVYYYGPAVSDMDSDRNGTPDNAVYKVTYKNNKNHIYTTSPSNLNECAQIIVEGVNSYAGRWEHYFAIKKLEFTPKKDTNAPTPEGIQLVYVTQNADGTKSWEPYSYYYNNRQINLNNQAFVQHLDLQRTYWQVVGMDDAGNPLKEKVTELLGCQFGTDNSNRSKDFYLTAQTGETASWGDKIIGVNVIAGSTGTVASLFNMQGSPTLYYTIKRRPLDLDEDGYKTIISGTGKGDPEEHKYNYTTFEYEPEDLFLAAEDDPSDTEHVLKITVIDNNTTIIDRALVTTEYETAPNDENENETECRNRNTVAGSTVVAGIGTIEGFQSEDYFDETKYPVSSKGPRIVIKGIGNFTGTYYYYFTIKKRDLPEHITIDDVPYMADQLVRDDLKEKIAVTSTSGNPLEWDQDYNLDFDSLIDLGTNARPNPFPPVRVGNYRVTVKGQNDYGGEKAADFGIKYNLAPNSIDPRKVTGTDGTTTTEVTRDQGYVRLTIDNTYEYKIQDGNVYRVAVAGEEHDTMGFYTEPIAKVTSEGKRLDSSNEMLPNVTIPMVTKEDEDGEPVYAEYGYMSGNQICPRVTSLTYYNYSAGQQLVARPVQSTDNAKGDYAVGYGINEEKGTIGSPQNPPGSITITAEDGSGFMGKIKLEFNIGSTTLTESDITIEGTNGNDHFWYTGGKITPDKSAFTITNNGTTIPSDQFELIYPVDDPGDPAHNVNVSGNRSIENANPSNYVDIQFKDRNIEITGGPNGATDTIRKYFYIDPVPLDPSVVSGNETEPPAVTVTVPDAKYTGAAQQPKPVLTLGNYTLNSGTANDFTIKENVEFTLVETDEDGNAVPNEFTIEAGNSGNFTGEVTAQFKLYYDLQDTTIEWYKLGDEQKNLTDDNLIEFPYSPKEGGMIPPALVDNMLTPNGQKNTGFILRAQKATGTGTGIAYTKGPAVPIDAYTVSATGNTSVSDGGSYATLRIEPVDSTNGLVRGTQKTARYRVIRNNLNEGTSVWGDNMPEVRVVCEEVKYNNSPQSPAVHVLYGLKMDDPEDCVEISASEYSVEYRGTTEARTNATRTLGAENQPSVRITANNTRYITEEKDSDGNPVNDSTGNPITWIEKPFVILPRDFLEEYIHDFEEVITLEDARTSDTAPSLSDAQLLTIPQIKARYTHTTYKEYATINSGNVSDSDTSLYYVQSGRLNVSDPISSSYTYTLQGGKDFDIQIEAGTGYRSTPYSYTFVGKGNYEGTITKPFYVKHAFREWDGQTDTRNSSITLQASNSILGLDYRTFQNNVLEEQMGTIDYGNIIKSGINPSIYTLTYGASTKLQRPADYDVTYNDNDTIYPGLIDVFFTPSETSQYDQSTPIRKTLGVTGSVMESDGQIEIECVSLPRWTNAGPIGTPSFKVSWKAIDKNGGDAGLQQINSRDYDITVEYYFSGDDIIWPAGSATTSTSKTPTSMMVRITGKSAYCTGEDTWEVPFSVGGGDTPGTTPEDPDKISLTTAQLEFTPMTFTYDGGTHYPQQINIIAADGTRTPLTEGTDYRIGEVAGYNRMDPGDQKVQVIGQGEYTGSQEITYSINRQQKIDLSEATVELSQEYFEVIEGMEQKPTVLRVSVNGISVAASDYDVTFPDANYSRVGTKRVRILPSAAGEDRYDGSKIVTYEIIPVGASEETNLANAIVTYDPQKFTADGTEKQPTTITVRIGNTTLTRGVDYTVMWLSDNYRTPGEKQFTIATTGTSIYWGSKTVTYTVDPAGTRFDLSKADITLTPSEFVEDGEEHKPSITVRADGVTLVENTDYTVSWPSADYTTQGIKAVLITAKGDAYEGERTVNFTINPSDNGDDNNKDKINISGGTLELMTTHYKYDGLEKRPSISKVVVDGRTLDIGVDYTVEYYNNTDIGTGVVVVTGIGNYYGTLMTTFVISRTGAGIVDPDDPDDVIDFNAVNAVSISGVANSYIYTGNDIEPKPGVTTNARRTLEEGVDYEVIYMNNRNVGTAAVVVAAKGSRYTGALTTYYSIWKKTINQCSISMSSKDRPYTGKPRTPAVTVKDGSRTLVAGTDYSVTYKNNTKIGLATAVVQGEGNYKDNKNISFRIVTGKVENVKNTSSKKKAVTLKWNKVTKATGYEIYTSDRKTKVATVKNATTVQVKGLKPGVQYKYRVRAFVKQDGEKVYGEFSDAVVTATKPKKVTAKASAATARTVRLTWNKVKGSGYVVYRATSSNGKYKKLKAVTSAATLSYTDTSVVSGRTYFYKIRAYRKASGKKVFGAYSTPVGVVAR